MKKKLLILVMVSIILFCLFTVFYTRSPPSNQSHNTIQTSYEYTIEIIVSQSENYTIYVPVPLVWSDAGPHLKEVSDDVVKKLRVVRGNANFSLIDTEKGKALRITGNNNTRIEGFSYVPTAVLRNPLTLSVSNYTWNDTFRKYWIYADIDGDDSNLRLSIEFRLVGYYSWEEIKINGNLISGWQQVDGKYGEIVTN